MGIELAFFIYAYPSLGGCATKISESEKSELEEMISHDKAPSKERLAEIFPDAFRRMQEKLGDNYWTSENVRKYWWTEHNKIIDNKEEGYENATKTHQEICKVKFWEVLSSNKTFSELKNKSGQIIRGLNYRQLELNPGQYVVTHKKHIAKDVTKNDYETYG